MPAPPTRRAILARTWTMRLLTLLFALLCGPLALWSAPGLRILPAVGIGCILYLLLLRSPSWGTILTLLYLSFLGGVRRWIMPALGWTSTDPLLLVGPGLVFAYFLKNLLTQRFHLSTRLERTLLWLLAVMFLEIINPIQGGLGVGLAGVLFTVVPVLWYYYGRDFGSEAVMRRLLWAVVVVAVMGAMYGLYQTYFGLLPAEKEWVEQNKDTYNALFITQKIVRAFSFFTSAQEYVQFISIGVVVLWAAFLRGKRLALLPVPLLAMAIFLSSIRGAVVITLVACVVVWAVQGRTWVAWAPRMALAIVLAAGGLFWSLQQVQQNTYDKQTSALVTHQVKGLLKPTSNDQTTSTATTHLSMLTYGIMEGFRVPIGRGLGSTTIAANKFNEGGRQSSTEWDVSDCFAALGFAGGLLYTCIVFYVLTSAVQWWRATRSLTALATLGVLVVHIGHWLHGGSYAATMAIWFLIGGMERARMSARLAQAQALADNQTGSEEGSARQTKERFLLQNTPHARWQGRKAAPSGAHHNTPRARWQVRQGRAGDSDARAANNVDPAGGESGA